MTTLLGDSSGLGYGVPAGRPVMTFVDEVAGMEVEWTLGVALSLADPALLMRKVRRLTRPAERERERDVSPPRRLLTAPRLFEPLAHSQRQAIRRMVCCDTLTADGATSPPPFLLNFKGPLEIPIEFQGAFGRSCEANARRW